MNENYAYRNETKYFAWIDIEFFPPAEKINIKSEIKVWLNEKQWTKQQTRIR